MKSSKEDVCPPSGPASGLTLWMLSMLLFAAIAFVHPSATQAQDPGVLSALNPSASPLFANFQPPYELETPLIQDTPGGLGYGLAYRPETDLLPEFVYQEAAYYRAMELHIYPEYAPRGYVARDYQDAPGVPEFTRLTPPVRVTPEERARYVTGGIYPGSFLAPGTNTSFRLRGFVRLSGFYDFEPIGVADAFVTNSIPVPQTVGQNVNASGRISRFALESWTPIDWCDQLVHTFIEGDFFNGPAQAAGGGGNPFRLRHAFVDIGYFRLGQQNTVFMDGTNWPSLVDFQGPNGWVNQRQPSARVTLPLTDRFFWAASLDRPFSDISTNDLGTNVQDVPDLASHLRWEGNRGHLQLSGLARSIGYRPTDGAVTRLAGGGGSVSAVFHPWAILLGTDPVHDENPSGLTRSRILLQGTWGAGIARYINDNAGQGLDAQVDPVTGAFDLVGTTAWNASYEHWFNASWLSNVTYSEVYADSNANQPGTTYDSAKYFAVSVWWIPFPRTSLGLEYLWGQRENLDGQSAQAQRLNGLAQYNF